MDWSRAKSILILGFICLNLFLGTRLWLEASRYPTGAALVPLEEITETRRHLQEAGFELAVPIPRETPPLPLLKVQVSPVNPRQVAGYFFGTLEGVRTIRVADSQGEVLFLRDGEELTVYPNGIVSYRQLKPGARAGFPTAQRFSEQAVRSWAERYIADQREFGLELQLAEVRALAEQDKFLVRMEQFYQGRPLIGSAGVEAVVAPWGVEFLWQRWLKPLGPSGEKKAIIPASEALLRLSAARGEQLAGDHAVIDEITLGFYNKLYDAQEWEAVPIWAIRTDDGQWFYVNAFTGEMEQ